MGVETGETRVDSMPTSHSDVGVVLLEGSGAYRRGDTADDASTARPWERQARHYAAAVDAAADAGVIEPQHAAGVHAAVQELLSGKSNYVTDAQRQKIAAEIYYHAAHGRADQGKNPTCGANSIENYMWTVRPDMAARIITSIALNANWVTPQGATIAVEPKVMQPNAAETKFPPADSMRSHASRLLQIGLINDIGAHSDGQTYQFGERPGTGVWSHLISSMDPYWVSSSGEHVPFTGLTSNQLSGATARLFGDAGMLMEYTSPHLERFTEIANSMGLLTSPHADKLFDRQAMGPIMFSSLIDFRQQLKERVAAGKLPAFLSVDGFGLGNYNDTAYNVIYETLKEVVNGPLGSGFARALGAADHMVLVKKYDPVSDRVLVGNSVGKRHDGWMPLKDLYAVV